MDFDKKIRDSAGNSHHRAKVCDEIVAHIRDSVKRITAADFLKSADLIQQHRDFHSLYRMTDAFLQYQKEHPQVRRRCAQALIEQGYYTAALNVLDPIISSATREENKKEYFEAIGLQGRVRKQLYINASARSRPALLEKAILNYEKGYDKDPANNSWHGVNAGALLTFATRNKVRLPGIEQPGDKAKRLAQDVIRHVSASEKSTIWDLPNLAEAQLILGNEDAALRNYIAFANEEKVSAFALGSALRQLEEIWQAGTGSETEKMIIASLRSALLAKPGGHLDLSPENIDSDHLHTLGDNKAYEKVLGTDAFNSYQWFVLGTDRAHNVAQIETAAGTAFGTGFLVRGGDFCEKFGDQQLFFTNAHVISKGDPDRGALAKEQARIRFELLSGSTEYRVAEILWHSPVSNLDATLVRLDKPVEGAKELYPISLTVPLVSRTSPQRILIIGHPKGMRLQFSIKDNALIDAREPYIHYRAPTMGGSSGSPVFNEEWELIGLHHAGGFNISKLSGTGRHDANEGITMKAIVEQTSKDLAC